MKFQTGVKNVHIKGTVYNLGLFFCLSYVKNCVTFVHFLKHDFLDFIKTNKLRA